MKILQVKKFPIYDIFEGDGWEMWSRYLLKNGKFIYIAGNKLNPSIFNTLPFRVLKFGDK